MSTAWDLQVDSSQVGSETAPSSMARRVVSVPRGKEAERRVAEDVGRTRVVSFVVERRRGISSRPMLPEAEVMRIDFGDIPCFFGSWT